MVRYGIAIVSVGLALGLALLLSAVDITVTPFLFAIAITVWHGGRGPGALAIALSILCLDYFFIAPIHHVEASLAHLPHLVVFTVLAVAVSWLSASRRDAEQLLRQTRDQLEVTVAERTAESRRTAAELEAILNGSPVGIALFDRDQTIQRCNPAFEQILGSSADDIAGRPLPVAAVHQAQWRAHADRLSDGEAFARVETRLVRNDLTEFDAAVSCAPLPGERASLTGFVGTIEDITDRKRADEARRQSEAKLEDAQRMAHLGYWHRDFGTDRITWSDETYRIFGLPPQQQLLDLATFEQLVHSADRQVVRRAVTEAVEGAARYDVEYRVVRPDGDVRIVHGQGDVTRDAAGEPHHMFGTVQDITERKRTEQLLEDLASRLINAQEDERRRIGRELHDHISQMLGLLSIRIDQLRADPAVPPTIAHALTELHQGASEVTADAHRLSHRLHSSTLDYLGLVPALEKLARDFSTHHGIAIEFTHASMPAPLPTDVALCLFRVAEESLTNVAKHSHARSARVHLTGASDGIRLTVADDGDGFDVASLREKAGLGVVSMQERLRVLRGTVRLESAPAQGTKVNAWVPATSLLGSPPGGGARTWTHEPLRTHDSQ